MAVHFLGRPSMPATRLSHAPMFTRSEIWRWIRDGCAKCMHCLPRNRHSAVRCAGCDYAVQSCGAHS
eukprot:6197125-Pleurochrysis_carterae.AAC.5